MMDWMSEYWWLSLIALLIGLATAYWIWCVPCPGDERGRDADLDQRTDTKVEPAKPLEPKKPEITAAKPMNFKDAPGFDTGKAATTAAAAGAAGLAAAAVAKASDPVEPPPAPEPAPPPKATPTPKPAEKPAAKAVKTKAVKAEPVKAAAVKAAPAAKAPAKKSAAKTEAVAKSATAKTKAATPKPPAVKTASKAAVAEKAAPLKTAATAKPATKAAAKPAAKAAAKPAPKTAVKAAPVKAAAPAKPKAEPAKKPAAKKPAATKAAATGVAALGAVMNEAGKPKIRGAGAGKADDLELIKGVGPKLNTLLISLGVTRFAQIASWSAADVGEVDQYLGNFTGRIARDNWVDQAGYLAKGDLAGFAKKYGEVGSEIKK